MGQPVSSINSFRLIRTGSAELITPFYYITLIITVEMMVFGVSFNEISINAPASVKTIKSQFIECLFILIILSIIHECQKVNVTRVYFLTDETTINPLFKVVFEIIPKQIVKVYMISEQLLTRN